MPTKELSKYVETTPIYDTVVSSFRKAHIVEDIKAEVVKLLVTKYDMTDTEAQEKVDESVSNDPQLWHENASSEDLASHLDNDDDDE